MQLPIYFKKLVSPKGLLIFLVGLLTVQSAYSQTISVNGKVTNEQGNALSGATVVIKGTTNGTITSSDGVFTLNDVSQNATLQASIIGYEKQEIKLNGRSQLTITLRSKTNELDETIIRAYGTTTRRLNTGSIGKVTAEEIERQPVSNPLAALEGRVPGLVVTQSNGVPGSGFKVQIRGQNSIAQGSEPLFVIDGVPFAPGNASVNGLSSALGSGGLSPFNSINPLDIESIEVLKDADATAIYGSRGANGVILITTKKGKVGKTKFNINAWSGISQVAKKLNLLNTSQYLQMRHEAFANDKTTPSIYNAPDILSYDTTRYTDFQKLLIGGTAHTTAAQLSLTGGSEQMAFLLSSSFHSEGTVYPGDLADHKGSIHLNLTYHSPDKKLNVNFNTNFSIGKNELVNSNPMSYIFLPPDYPELFDNQGNLNWLQNGQYFNNPLAYTKQDYTAQTDNLLNNLSLSYLLFSGFQLKLNAGYNLFQLKETGTNPASSQNPKYHPKGYSNFANNKYKSWIIEPQVTYEKEIGKSKINILIGASWQQDVNNSASFYAYGYTNEALLKSMSAASSFSITDDNFSTYRYNALFGRINYNYVDKYILNLSGRRDGSSRFGPGRQFANFGAIGAAWIFTDEKFIKQTFPFLSFGKLRGSYGTTGNDQIGNYRYLNGWESTPYPYQDISGLKPSRLFNPDYSWEINRKLEAAVELGFVKNKILLNLSWYRNRSSNQLINYPEPSQTGFTNILKNFPALVQNSGWELDLSFREIDNDQFHWSSRFLLSIPHNKLISFPGIKQSSYAHSYLVGKSLNLIYRFHLTGVDPKTGVYQFKDINKDGDLNSSDYVFSGNLDPKFYGGFSNNISYKGFELNIFFQFRKQKGRNYLSSFTYPPPGNMGNILTHIFQNRWQHPGRGSSFQKFTTTYGTDATTASLYYLSSSDGIYGNTSFIRLKNVSLSYSFPSIWIKHIGIKEAMIYLQGQNLLTITGYKGFDPETQQLNSLPPLRTITAGIKISL